MTDETRNFPLQSGVMDITEPERTSDFDRSPAAFEKLYRQYLKPIYCYLYLKTGSPAEAEDLTSQVFLSALEALPRYRHQGHFSAWLFSLARRKAADFYRSHQPQASLDENGIEPPAPEVDLLAGVIHRAELQSLGRLIAALPEDERELIRLRFAAGLGFEEIAAILGKKTSAIKMALYRLLERMEKQLEASHV